MAYELSSSFTSGVTPQSVVGTSGGRHSGGRFSPDGSKIGVQNRQHGGAGSGDNGIDFYQSGSGGWARTESLDANSSRIRQFVWYSDSIIFAIEGNSTINQYNSSSSGWSFTRQAVQSVGTTISDIALSPSKTRAVIYGDSLIMNQYTVSTSSAWDTGGEASDDPDRQRFSESGNTPSNPVKSIAWIDDENFFVGMPQNTGNGRIQRYERDSGTGLFQKQEDMNGSTLNDLGDAMIWHASSSALVVGGGTSSDRLSLHVIPSSSAYGFLPASNPQNFDIVIDVSSLESNDGDSPPKRLLNKGLGLRIDPTDGNRLIGATRGESGSPYDDGVLFSLESGSSGWKVKQFFNNHADLTSATERNVDIYGGTIVANNNVYGTSDDTFLVWNAIESDPALNSSATESITTSGGTVKAGGTQASPLATVSVPAGALASTTTIGIDLTGDDNAITNGINSSIGSVGLTAYSPVVEVTPHGQTFASAVTLSFQLTGAVAGTKPGDLVVYKSLTADGPWYKLPAAFYNCSDSGVITLTATSFSRYQAQGGQHMARTTLNNNQIAKLVKPNKAVARALDLTGSLANQNGASYISATDLLVLHRTGSQAQPVSASVLQDFFSKVDITETGTDAAFQILFADDDSAGGGDGVLRVDGSHLTYNPNSNLLSVGGDLNLGGHLVADADEAKNIFAAVETDSNAITIGGGGKVVMGGDLQLSSNGKIDDSNGDVRFTATHGGATILHADNGDAGLTIAQDNSDVTVAGDLVVSGNDLTFGNGATIVNGDASTLTITEAVVALSGDLKVGGEGIQAADGNERISLADALVLKDESGDAVVTLGASDLKTTLAGDLLVSGNDIDFSSGNATIGASMGSNSLTIGVAGSTVILPGNLTVQGTVTSVDSTTINVSSSFTFEGPADAHETTLHAGGDGTGDAPQADTNVYLPALSAGNYFLPVLADKATAASSAVLAAEFALLDGGTARGTTAVSSGDGFLHNDAGQMRMTSVDKIADLFAGQGLAAASGVLNITGSGISAEDIAVSEDTLMFFDADGSPKQESFADLATAQAGAGLAASGGQLIVDVSEFSAATPAASDSFLTLDSDGSTEQRTTTDALATLFAGAGMTASTAVISVVNATNGGIAVAADDIKVDIDDLSAVTTIASGDTFAIAQQAESGDPTKKITFDNMAAKLGGAGLTPTAGVLAVVNASNGGIAVAADDIKVDIDDLAAVTAIASGDTFAIAQQAESGDPTKKITFDNMAAKLAGDGLAASSGVLAIQSVQRTFRSGSAQVTTGSAVNITDNYGSAIVQASFHVYLNGMLQTRSGSLDDDATVFDYEISGTTLTLQSAMDSDDVLVVSYIKNS